LNRSYLVVHAQCSIEKKIIDPVFGIKVMDRAELVGVPVSAGLTVNNEVIELPDVVFIL